ncbi:Rrf2 family transcriptional regulator [Gorillibacterium sp. CAU 1737]|uniref:Rrf2 family transcriptional regulator n=1 Tax=Gorillibacterium sp. CAU 1737 TaxID=3140362 RepID=UPI003261355D
MTGNSRFAVAVHILSLLVTQRDERLSSDRIAESVNTNPVVIRRIIGMLNRAGLVQTMPGVAGARLTRLPEELTLLDIYWAVQDDPKEGLFAIHEHPNPDCPVGQNIQAALQGAFCRAQTAMERELSQVTLSDMMQAILFPA